MSTVDSWPKRYNVEFNWYSDKQNATVATYDYLCKWGTGIRLLLRGKY